MSHEVGDYGGRLRPFDSEAERLRWLAASLDPETERCMREIGIGPGWRCLEVGAATGSMSRWMAEQVGAEGRVVAADLDTRFLAGTDLPNVEVRTLDLRTDPLERGRFDLVYARTLLLHLPDADTGLRRMAEAVAPGGWLFAHEPDMCVCEAADPDHPSAAGFEAFHRTAFRRLRERKLFDTRFGRRLPTMFRTLGLERIEVRAFATLRRGATAATDQLRRTFGEVLRPFLLEDGVVTEAELEQVVACYDDPDFEFLSGLELAVWGRRPESRGG